MSQSLLRDRLIGEARVLVNKPRELAYDNKSKLELQQKIISMLKENRIELITHYYCPDEVQELTELAGGFIGDSLEMARYGANSSAEGLLICGVRFMGETAKILAPNKTVYVPDLNAECSLDLSCSDDAYADFIAKYPNHQKVVYANTSAKVKSMSDWVVTSSMALSLVNHLAEQGHSIAFAPDKHLGAYIQSQTQADMVLFDGSCIVHDMFKANSLKGLKASNPDAKVLVHPESPPEVVALADVVGSTTQLLNAVKSNDSNKFIVATERGIFYKMKQAAPDKILIQAPNGGSGASCQSCAYCPWMGLNQLEKILSCLKEKTGEIKLSSDLCEKARIPLDRMLNFAAR